MTDAELGAMVRRALASGGTLATLTLRRGHPEGAGAYVAQLHVYAEHAHPSHPESGTMCEGRHGTGKGATLDDAITAVMTAVGRAAES